MLEDWYSRRCKPWVPLAGDDALMVHSDPWGCATFVIVTGIVLFVVLRVDGENLLRCAERTYVILDHLVSEGCVYVLEVHYHSFNFT